MGSHNVGTGLQQVKSRCGLCSLHGRRFGGANSSSRLCRCNRARLRRRRMDHRQQSNSSGSPHPREWLDAASETAGQRSDSSGSWRDGEWRSGDCGSRSVSALSLLASSEWLTLGRRLAQWLALRVWSDGTNTLCVSGFARISGLVNRDICLRDSYTTSVSGSTFL